MAIPERRRLSRVAPYELAFIAIGPENGGIVLNVSAEGLCFESAAPVERGRAVLFSLLDHNYSPTSTGDIVWIDDTGKRGGIRFARVNRKDRHEIDQLLTDPVVFNCENTASAAPVPRLADASRAYEVSIGLRGNQCAKSMLPEKLDGTALVPAGEPRQKYSTSLFVVRHKDTSRADASVVRTRSSNVAIARSKWRLRKKNGWLLAGLSSVIVLALVTSILIGRSVQRVQPAAALIPARQRVATESELRRKRELPVPSRAATPAQVAKQPVVPRRPQHPRSTPSKASAGTVGAAITGETIVRTDAAEEADYMLVNAAPEKFRYPIAPNRTLTGQVRVRILIGRDGSVENVSILSGNAALANATVRAIRHWRYHPLESNGIPIKGQAYVSVSFMGDEAVSINFYKWEAP